MRELPQGNNNRVVALFSSRGVVTLQAITRNKLSACAIVCLDVGCSSTSRDYAQDYPCSYRAIKCLGSPLSWSSAAGVRQVRLDALLEENVLQILR
jgi:hypothetical protein